MGAAPSPEVAGGWRPQAQRFEHVAASACSAASPMAPNAWGSQMQVQAPQVHAPQVQAPHLQAQHMQAQHVQLQRPPFGASPVWAHPASQAPRAAEAPLQESTVGMRCPAAMPPVLAPLSSAVLQGSQHAGTSVVAASQLAAALRVPDSDDEFIGADPDEVAFARGNPAEDSVDWFDVERC